MISCEGNAKPSNGQETVNNIFSEVDISKITLKTAIVVTPGK